MTFTLDQFKAQYLSLLSNFHDCTGESTSCNRCETGREFLDDADIQYLLLQTLVNPRLFSLLLYDCIQIGAALRDAEILKELTKL